MTMETEIWKAHPDFAGIEVSTFGRVRTLDRVTSSETMTRFTKGRILKQQKDNKGYLKTKIPVDGKWITKRVHRLVAQTFISNPDSLPEVNHKDNDRTNNHVDNLEFCTRSYNIKYREEYGKAQNKPVFAINLSTLEVSKFRSQNEAGRKLGVFVSNINIVIKGRQKKSHGYWFVNADDKAVDIINQKLHDIGKTELKI